MKPGSLAELVIGLQTARWNRLVAPRYRLMPSLETDTHMTFLHPTKGYRKISKKRLGL